MSESSSYYVAADVLDWLMQGDPSIRYLTSRDILDDKKDDIHSHRMFVDVEGWGKAFLDKQGEDGKWDGKFVTPEYTSTVWVLTELRRLGLPRDNYNAKKAADLLLDAGLQKDGGINFSESDETESEVCHSALVLSALSYFRVVNPRREAIFEYLIESQLDDGGWNCNWKSNPESSSFDTTITVLEALREYSKVTKGDSTYINMLQAQAQEFLLKHHLYLKTDESEDPVDEKFLNLTYPTYSKYDILTALDYFQSINHPYDQRFEKAILSLKRRRERGMWKMENLH